MTANSRDGINSGSEATDPNNLDEAFRFLFDGLRTAKDCWASGGNNGRNGAIHALETVIKFLSLFDVVNSEALHAPIVCLFNDIMALDDNNVSPILKPIQRSGRALDSSLFNSIKGVAVFTVHRLMETGLTAPESREQVAKALENAGLLPSRKGSDGGAGKFTARTVRKWCEDVSADIGKHSEAAQALDLANAGFTSEILHGLNLVSLPVGQTATSLLMQNWATKDVQSVLLKRLALSVSNFTGRKPPVPPS